MTVTRRDWLRNVGLGTASSLLWTYGCGGAHPFVARPVEYDEVGGWLRDAVARVAGAFPTASVQALAVSRRRASAAVDVLGAAVTRARRDGVVLSVRDANGQTRERVTSALTAAGIAAAATALAGTATKRLEVTAPPAPRLATAPPTLDDHELRDRAAAMAGQDHALTSRIVYAASLIEIDDSTVWSVGREHDRVQRAHRVMKRILRAAWEGTRPVITEASRGWVGETDEQQIPHDTVERTTRDALEPMTPGAFADGERAVVLDPSIAAAFVEASARALLTATAAARPELAARVALGSVVGAITLTLVDDPGAAGAYGGFAFDDAGTPATPITLLAGGTIAGRLTGGPTGGRSRRPGHIGLASASPSHLRVTAGTGDESSLLGDGLRLEGSLGVTLSTSSPRVLLSAARAREFKNGETTGRVYADVEIVGELPALLGAMTGVANNPITLPFRDEIDGEPRFRSVETAAVATRGFVRTRRHRA